MQQLRIIGILGCLLVMAGCTMYKTDGPAPKKSDKIYICHKGQTMRLPDNAIRAHLNHGDRLGACSAENNN